MYILLAISVIASLTLLVACKKDNGGGGDDNTPKTRTELTSVMMAEVMENLQSSFDFGQQFGIDVLAAAVVDDKTAANKDIKFDLAVKGNIDVKDAQSEKNSNLFLELTKTEGDKKDTILGIGYEYINGDPYFFVNVLDEKYHKVNGYSALSLYSIIEGIDLGSITSSLGGINIMSVLAQLLFGSTGTITDSNIYTFNFDLALLLNEIKPMLPVLSGAIGIDSAQIDSLIADLFGGLKYEKNGETLSVDSFDSLCYYVENEMSFKGTVEFKFENKKFKSAAANFNYAENGTDKTGFSLDVSKAEIGVANAAIDTFASFPMNADQRRTATATNLLNYQLNGQAVGYLASGAVSHIYDISLNIDLDPFVLLDLLKSDAPSLDTVLGKLGYINLTVDEVSEDGEFVANMVTIHSNFSEGFVVVNFDAHNAPGNNLGLGGVYSFDALVDIIQLLMNPAETAAAEASVEGESSGGTDILGMVKDILGMFIFDDVYNNGVTIKTGELGQYILEMTGMEGDNILKIAVNTVFGNAVLMNIKVFDATYGACERIDTSIIECTIRDKDNDFINKDFIKEITGITELSTVEQNAGSMSYYVGEKLDVGKFYPMTGINLAGEEVTTSGYIMYTDLDTSYPGEQLVTFYIGIGHELYKTIASMNLDGMIPLYGTLKYQTLVNVIEYEKDAVVETNAKTDVRILAGETNLFSALLPSGESCITMTIKGETERSYKLKAEHLRIYDLNGNDVTDEMLSDGTMQKIGVYLARFEMGGYFAEVEVRVDQLVVSLKNGKPTPTTVKVGEVVDLDYQVMELFAEGTSRVIEGAAIQYKVGKTSYNSPSKRAELYTVTQVDGKDVYTLNMWGIFLNEVFEISFKVNTTYCGNSKTARTTTTIVAPDGLPESFKNEITAMYPNQNINGLISFVQGDKTYYIKNDGGSTWYAESEDGVRYDSDMNIKVYYDTTDVILDSKGRITNLPNTYKAGGRSTKILTEISYKGIVYKATSTAYELSAINGQSAKLSEGAYINGKIQYAQYIYYELNGAVVALEFRYVASLGKYAIVVADTDTVAFDVTVKVTDADGNAVTLTDGSFAGNEFATYSVEYEVDIDGIAQKFYHSVKYMA